MKRNHLPDSLDDLNCDKEIIDLKLNQLISDQTRCIASANQGFWDNNQRHVRVKSTKNIPPELMRYSSELKYHFLSPLEALYCLETSRIIIYYNELPLSLCEAYQLLLPDRLQFINYRIFQHLNRSGYICLTPGDNSSTPDVPAKGGEYSQAGNKLITKNTPSNLETDSDQTLSKEILRDLRKKGPQDCDWEFAKISDEQLNVTFEAYKRETYSKHRPRKGKQGSPDYRVVICDKDKRVPVGLKHQVVRLECNRISSASNVGDQPSGEYLYVLVDYDTSICYAKFRPLNASNLELL